MLVFLEKEKRQREIDLYDRCSLLFLPLVLLERKLFPLWFPVRFLHVGWVHLMYQEYSNSFYLFCLCFDSMVWKQRLEAIRCLTRFQDLLIFTAASWKIFMLHCCCIYIGVKFESITTFPVRCITCL